MVANLTVGKKKYAEVEEEIKALNERINKLNSDFLSLIDKDAEGFKGLAAAYGMKTETEEQKAEKARVLEEESVKACAVPMEIMECCCRAIDIIEVFAAKGSRLAVSDAGAGALFCKTALEGASLNIFINTKSLKDRQKAAELNARAEAMIAEYGAKAQSIYDSVAAGLKA